VASRADAVSDPTENALSSAQSEKRAMQIPSARFDVVSRRKTLDKKDTGPWFIGKKVGEIYQIRGVLGRGGMGIVYAGYDTATHREIAVKVPLGTFVDDERGRKHFSRGAEKWSALVHPHICQRTANVRRHRTRRVDCCSKTRK